MRSRARAPSPHEKGAARDPATTDLSPELRRRVRDLRSTLRQMEDDLERAAEEAEDLAGRGVLTYRAEGMRRAFVPYSIDVARTGVRAALEPLEPES